MQQPCAKAGEVGPESRMVACGQVACAESCALANQDAAAASHIQAWENQRQQTHNSGVAGRVDSLVEAVLAQSQDA